MRLFDLYRLVDETGISGTGLVAQGVQFDDGTCALRWTTKHRSTALYDDIATVEAIHGHAGQTRIIWRSAMNTFDRGRSDCVQDRCENCPFASIGGIAARECPSAPSYIDPTERDEYLRGYAEAASRIYGADWRTCAFSWTPAIVVGGEP